MQEKRISLRFRMDNKYDRQVWEILEKAAKEQNTSKNFIALKLIQAGFMHELSEDMLAEKIAEIIVSKLGRTEIAREAKTGLNSVNCDTKESGKKQEDEPEVLSEDALDFLEMFG